MLKDEQDAFGHSVQDYLRGVAASEIAERDDGYIDLSGGGSSISI